MAERDNGCLVLQTGGWGNLCKIMKIKKRLLGSARRGKGGNLREIMKIKRQIPDPASSCPLGRPVSFPFGSLPFVLIQFNFNDR